jgi:hypothetical protein
MVRAQKNRLLGLCRRKRKRRRKSNGFQEEGQAKKEIW